MARRVRDVELSRTEAVHPAAEQLDPRSAAELVRRLHEADLEAVRAVGRAQARIVAAAELYAATLKRGGRVFYVGAGTSGRLGALDAAECPPTFGTRPSQIQAVMAGGPAALRRAVEGAEDDGDAGASEIRERCRPGDLVIGITASGRTLFVRGALTEAGKRGLSTVRICCAQPPADAPPVDVEIALETGPELLAGSTRLKAGTATKLVLNALSTSALAGLGGMYRGRMVDLKPTNEKLRHRAVRTVRELSGASRAKAEALLEKAQGRVSLALAMDATGLDRTRAARALAREGLDALLKRLRRPRKHP